MSRRFGRRNARGGSRGLSAAQALENTIHSLVPYSWPIVAYYDVDGVSGKVGSIRDNIRSGTGIKAVKSDHAYVQTDSAKQIAIPTALASLGNRVAGDFALAPYYVSNALASAWRNPHNGAGFTSFFIRERTTVAGTQFAWGTYGNVAETGAGLLTSLSTVLTVAYNGASLNMNANAASETTGAGYNSTTFATADTPDATIYRNAVSVGTANAGALSAGDPSGTMTLGANRAGNNVLNAKVGEWLFFDRSLTEGEYAIVRAYITARYGVT